MVPGGIKYRVMAFLHFLGTAGTRYIVIEQKRASGGIWLSDGATCAVLDPGPGSLVRALDSRPALDPSTLDAVILSHRHLDHSNDANIMIEAMTRGGREHRGAVFAPADALEGDPVVHRYLRGFPASVRAVGEGVRYEFGTVSFEAVKRTAHPGETWGLRFRLAGRTVSFIADGGYFEGLESGFEADLLVINVVMLEKTPGVAHLSMPEAERIIARLRPGRAVLTHFGRRVIETGPEEIAAGIASRTGVPVLAAADGLRLEL